MKALTKKFMLFLMAFGLVFEVYAQEIPPLMEQINDGNWRTYGLGRCGPGRGSSET